MIRDQTIVSARAEKRKQAVGRRVARGILTASMAAVLTLPSLAAWGVDGPHSKPKAGNVFETIALPPIPYLDSMPWLKWGAGVNTLKVDILLSPTLDPSGIKLMPEERDGERPAISSLVHSQQCDLRPNTQIASPTCCSTLLFDHARPTDQPPVSARGDRI